MAVRRINQESKKASMKSASTLETFPDKITVGTDCFPYNAVLGAEESYWLGAESSRTALAAALAEMVPEGEITEARALALAHGYLHHNAVKLCEGKVH
jgi:hypothetical protein